MVKKTLFKLIILVMIGFSTILLFSNLSAQTKTASEPSYPASFTPSDDPLNSDSIFSMYWHQNSVQFGLRDSLKSIITDSTFNEAIVLISKKKGSFSVPFPGKVTSKFGPRRYRYHYGTDINLNTGDTVVAAFDGKVRIAAYHQGYGYLVVIRHLNGLESVYGHLSKIIADTNQMVKAGQAIGLGGNTGRSYGSHLHFELRYMGIPFNAQTVIDFETGKLLNDTLMLTSAQFDYMKGKSSTGGATATGSNAIAKYHKVKSGENLSVIAQRNHTTVTRLCQLNHISRTTTLQIGRTLRIR
jgi:murein DD-endopeptidase MepM/ murein hydrolase activator NlpD